MKASFRLKDKHKVESVLLNLFPGKWSICISTQVGCPVQCVFCATGRRGLKRNLSPDEIVSQYVFWANYLKKYRPGEKIGGVVYMGMGEPFLNYDSVAESLKVLTDPGLIGLGDRHISVSTVGHVPGIRRFAKDFPQVNLAVSLHAVDNELRSRLVPLNDNTADQIPGAQGLYLLHQAESLHRICDAGGRERLPDAGPAARRMAKGRGFAEIFHREPDPLQLTAYDYRASDKNA